MAGTSSVGAELDVMVPSGLVIMSARVSSSIVTFSSSLAYKIFKTSAPRGLFVVADRA